MSRVTNVSNPARIIALCGSDLKMQPGETIDVSDDDVAALSPLPAVRALFQSGALKDEDGAFAIKDDEKIEAPKLSKIPPSSTMRQAKAVDSILKLTEQQALRVISKTDDVKTLERWYHDDGRPNVKAALQQRAQEIGAKPAQ